MTNPRIIVPIADGVEEMEAVIIIDTLRRAKFNVVSASVAKTISVKASRGVVLVADIMWQTANLNEFDAIILPGGAVGTDNLMQSSSLLSAIKSYNDQNKLIGAICAGPLVLQAAGILVNRTITCHPGVSGELIDRMASCERVVKSGNLITSQGPGTAFEFALAIIRELANNNLAETVAAGLILPDCV